MNNHVRDAKFYVVGGPVQPGRDCYLHRNADAELMQRLEEGEYCHVLAQRQTGKTSLAASTARKLRATGTLVALVDLIQASGEDPSENAGRWYYSIAYRIVRELRIRADVQQWWKERGGLTNLQRMREFFLEVVLQETDKPVAIFFDRIEATINEPLAQDLFSAVRACYDARANDIEFQRLTFAMFGSGAPAEIVKNVQGSPFEVSTAVALPDFSPQEMAGLIAGLGEPLTDAEKIVSRIWTWTRGHPYLSQKVFRGLARRKDETLSAASVDDLVQNQFLASSTLRDEPHLSAIAEQLLREGPGRIARLNLYGRISKGVEVMSDPGSVAQRELLTAGVVTIGRMNEVRVRNEIYAMVFDTRWVNQNLPYGFKGMGIAAAIIAFVLAVPIWYTEHLPRPYVQALSAANQDYDVAVDAYESLSFFPSYAATANRLLENFLTRMSRQAPTLTDMMRIRSRLDLIPGGTERADELLADFWERRANEAAHAGDRDGALVALLEALQFPNDRRRRWAAELVGQDYRNLAGTLHVAAELQGIEADEAAGLLTLLDAANRAEVWRIDGERPRLSRSIQLIAEERPVLEERQLIENVSTQPRLIISTTHPEPGQVTLLVRAPSGQEAKLRLDSGKQLDGSFIAFDFTASPELRVLLSEELTGNWTIALSDLEQGISGELLDWGIVSGETTVVATENMVAQPIPEPRSSANATTRLATGGRLAMSWPAGPTTGGPVVVWDLAGEEILARVPRTSDFVDARFALGGKRIVTIEGRQLQVWESGTGKRMGRIPLNTEAGQRVRLSPNGRFAAINRLRADNTAGIVVWDLEHMRRTGLQITAENAGPVAVDSQGRYLAIGGRDPWIRVWSLADGTLRRELEHSSPLRSVSFDASGEWLASDDLSNTFRLWNVNKGGAPVIERLGSSAWSVDFSADSSSLLYGSFDRAYEVNHLPGGRGAGIHLRHARSVGPGTTRRETIAPVILASRNLVVTNDDSRSVKIWSVPAQQTTAVSGKSIPGGTRAALSRDGQRIAVGSASGDVRIYAVGAPGGILLGRNEADNVKAGDSEVVDLHFSPDRSRLASASLNGQVHVWDAGTGAVQDLLIVHPDGAAHDLLFADGGRYLISASRLEVLTTDMETGETVARLRIQANHPQLAIAAETGDVFIADDLNGVTVWNWRTGQSDRVIAGDFAIRTVAVTPDGSRLVTASDTQLLTHWDMETRKPLEQSVGAAGKIDEMWITADGNRLTVQAGYWLQSIALFSTGLSVRNTRLLSEAPAFVQPGASGEFAFILSASRSRPVVSLQSVRDPSAILLEGDPDKLRGYWRDRLAMSLDAEGRVQPVLGQAVTLSAVQPANY
ncbi:MAG TPA: AAA-like domain-containing protein [Gammaproteobacteria bacterium]|nr:AAA-like domain-containing protein [Gammaproteobacteria bacterium]